MGMIENQAIKYYSQEAIWDSTFQWLERKGTLQSWYRIVDLWFQLGELQKGLIALRKIPNKFLLSEHQQTEYDSFVALKRIVASLQKASKPIYDVSIDQRKVIAEIADEKSGPAGVQARAILNLIRITNESSPIQILERKVVLPISQSFGDFANGSNLHLYPNPTNNWVEIAFRIPNNLSLAQLVLRDINGRILKSAQVEESQTLRWDMSQWNSGVYFCTLYMEGEEPETQKLILIK